MSVKRYDDGSATDWFNITPNDSIDMTQTTRAIYVGATGNITANSINGTILTLVSVPQGTILPVRVNRIFASNTTAANLVGLI